jgi:hypothetical protein
MEISPSHYGTCAVMARLKVARPIMARLKVALCQNGTAQRPTGRGLWLAILLIHFGLLKTTFGLAKRFGYNFPPLH